MHCTGTSERMSAPFCRPTTAFSFTGTGERRIANRTRAFASIDRVHGKGFRSGNSTRRRAEEINLIFEFKVHACHRTVFVDVVVVYAFSLSKRLSPKFHYFFSLCMHLCLRV